MINMDRFDYQELAAMILHIHSKGFSWSNAQRMALAYMAQRYGWRP